MYQRAATSVNAIAIGLWLATCSVATAQETRQKSQRKVPAEPPSSVPFSPPSPAASAPLPRAGSAPKAPVELSKEKQEKFASRIRDLDATEFLTRETAMLQLL